MHRYHLTFDVDWAPDFVLEDCLGILSEASIQGTFFVTHETDLLPEIEDLGHELGIHPNFFPGSDHGETVPQIVEAVLRLAPNASKMRTHGLVQSTRMFYEIFSKFTQLKLDLSLLTQGMREVERFDWAFDDVRFHRINYNFEDDAVFAYPDFDWSALPKFGKTIIFDFHPIHVFLNSTNGSEYAALKKAAQDRPLWSLRPNDLAPHVNSSKPGVRTLLKNIASNADRSVSLDEI